MEGYMREDKPHKFYSSRRRKSVPLRVKVDSKRDYGVRVLVLKTISLKS